MKVYIIVTECL